ncbi:MAG: hypothetical protein IJC07_00010 [Clostridia bacterium]|nr:hypothetical protein [Clostridia bacterium]
MKQVTKKSLLSFLVVALLAIVCAFGVMGFNRSNTALASEALPEASVYQAATLADEADFSIKAGAGVETTTTGIKFTALVSETFHQEGYKYFATAQINGGTKVMEAAFTAAPAFVDGTAEICVYINGFGELNDAQKVAAAKAEWIVNAYAYDETTCIKAANGGEDNLQSMRIVAANAALDYTSPEVDGYDKEDITSYFVKSNFAEGVNGYAADDGIVRVSFAGAPVDATEIYINGIAANPDLDAGEIFYNEENARYWVYSEAFGAEELNTIGKAVLFTADGGVYATKIARGTPISSETDMITYFTSGKVATYDSASDVCTQNEKDVYGYYFLTSDIAMTKTWGYVSNLYGTFDGQGYTISNIKYAHIYSSGQAGNNKYFALFNPFGGTIRNMGLQIASVATHGGIVFGQGGDAQDSTMENLFVDVTPGYETNALIQKTQGGHHVIKDVVLHKRAYGKQSNPTISIATLSHFVNGAADKTPASFDIQNTYACTNSLAGVIDNDANYRFNSSAELATAIKDVKTFEQARAIQILEPWYELNQENIVDVLKNKSAGNHSFILTEDIDASALTFESNGGTGVNAFKGSFDGQGYTISGLQQSLFGAGSYSGNGATIKNLRVVNATKGTGSGNGVFFNQNEGKNNIVHVENVYVSFNVAFRYAVFGWGTGSGLYLRDTVIESIGTNTSAGMLHAYAHCNNVIYDNAAFIGSASIRSTTDNASNATTDWGTMSDKTATGEDASNGNGYYQYATLTDLYAAGNEDLVASAINLKLIVLINQDNAAETFTAGLTSGVYLLEEDIDLDGADFVAGSNTFTGYFDGNGHVIRNFKTNGLFAGSMNGKATIKNVGVQGVSQNSKTGGIFASQSNSGNSSNILIENVVVNMHAVEGSYGLLGQSVGMRVTLRNVVVNFENSSSASAGCVGTTSLSGTKIFDKFIGIGSIATITNATSRPDAIDNTHIAGFYGGGDNGWGTGYEYGPDGATAPVANQDYYNLANYAAFEAQLETDAFGLSEEALALIAKTGLVRKITKDNVAMLQYASNGTYYLEEDIDMSQVDLNGDGICDANDIWTGRQSVNVPFVGVLDGQGHSITNLRLGGKNYNGFFSNVGGGALIKNIKIEAVSQAHLNATLIGKIETGFAAGSKHTLTDGRVAGQINVVNTVLSSADLAGTKALITVFYNSNPSVILTDVVLMATGAYDDGYAVTDGGGNSINLTVNNVLVIVADSTTAQWYADSQTPALTGELVYAADSTGVETMYTGNDVVLGFFGLDPK